MKRNLIVGELYKVHGGYTWFSNLTDAKSSNDNMVFFITDPNKMKIPSDAVLLYLGKDLYQWEWHGNTKYTVNLLRFLWSQQSSENQTACQAIEVGIESSVANLFTKIS